MLRNSRLWCWKRNKMVQNSRVLWSHPQWWANCFGSPLTVKSQQQQQNINSHFWALLQRQKLKIKVHQAFLWPSKWMSARVRVFPSDGWWQLYLISWPCSLVCKLTAGWSKVWGQDGWNKYCCFKSTDGLCSFFLRTGRTTQVSSFCTSQALQPGAERNLNLWEASKINRRCGLFVEANDQYY